MTFLEFLVVLIASPVVGALLYGTYQFNREDMAFGRADIAKSGETAAA